MANCDVLISQDIDKNCFDEILAGIESNGIIINRNDVDIDNATTEEGRDNVYTAIPIKEGKRGYKIYVPANAPFTGTKTTLATGVNRNKFTHEVAFTILDNDPDICKNIIDGLANGTFVIIYENKYNNSHKPLTPSDSKFQVVGMAVGLKATTLENDKYSEDTEGGWNVVLTETGTPKSAYFLYAGSLALTRDLVETFLEPNLVTILEEHFNTANVDVRVVDVGTVTKNTTESVNGGIQSVGAWSINQDASKHIDLVLPAVERLEIHARSNDPSSVQVQYKKNGQSTFVTAGNVDLTVANNVYVLTDLLPVLVTGEPIVVRFNENTSGKTFYLHDVFVKIKE
jgi:hypothetical protein